MKTLLLAIILTIGLSAAASAQTQAASKTSRNNSTATATGTATGTISRRNSRFTKQTTNSGNTIYARPAQVDGAAVRAVRSGNPLQMINPFAPASYGDGHDVTRREPSDPYQRPEGIKLVTVEF